MVLRCLGSVEAAALYGVLFVTGLVEAAFPPFPGDAATVATSGLLAARGAPLAPALASSWAGSYLGVLFLWACGRQCFPWAAKRLRGRSGAGFARASALVARHGVLLLAVSRFVPGIRSLIVLAAGSAGVPLRRAAPALGVAVAMWQGIVVAGGYWVGRRWADVVSTVGTAGVAAFLVAGVVAWWVWARAKGGSHGLG